MQIEIVETATRFSEIEVDWDDLYRRDPHATVYLSSRFIASILVRAPGRFRILLAWTDDQRCVGALPLQIRTQWNRSANQLVNELHMLGRAFDADHTGVLCDPDEEAAVCDGFARALSAMSAARIVMPYVAGPRDRLERFCAAFGADQFDYAFQNRTINAGETDNLVSPYIDLPDEFSAYLETLSANTRQKTRRALRRCAEDPELHITRATPETFDRDATALADLWFKRHVARKGCKSATWLARQCRDVLAVGLANGLIHLTVLWRGETAVAAHALYVDAVKGHAIFHVGGRDETVRDLPVGLVLHAHGVRWAIAQGFSRYDFALGDEPYKYSLGAVDRTLFYAEISTKSGVNASGRLDEKSRADVETLIRHFAAKGRADDARAAARQAAAVWPDMEAAADVEALINAGEADGRTGRR
ncbi:MAG: GNAT family N-acetyltransferase [Pseudomonadota bacterium]